jgi:hypothetical protein
MGVRVLENRVLRIHNEELYDMYSSQNIIRVIRSRRIRWAGHVAHRERDEVSTGFLWSGHEIRRPLGRPRHRRDDGINMDLQEVGWGIYWTDLAHGRDGWRELVNAVMNLRVAKDAGHFFIRCWPVSFTRRTVIHGVAFPYK